MNDSTNKLSEALLEDMLSVQAARNELLLVGALERGCSGPRFLQGVLVEGAGLLECLGWRWWLMPEADLVGAQDRLLEIWHYLLSESLLDAEQDPKIARRCVLIQLSSTSIDLTGENHQLQGLSLLDLAQLLIGSAAVGIVPHSVFAELLARTGLSWPQLYQRFIARAVLDRFRRDHGYAGGGNYLTIWEGRSDQEHAQELSEQAGAEPGLHTRLYAELEGRYSEALSMRRAPQ